MMHSFVVQVLAGGTHELHDIIQFIAGGICEVYKIVDLVKYKPNKYVDRVNTYLYDKLPSNLMDKLNRVEASQKKPKMIYRKKGFWLIGKIGEGFYFGTGKDS